MLSEDELAMSFCGTAEYLAPEMVSKQGHDKAIDWWALGVMAFEFMYPGLPFPGKTPDEVFDNIVNMRINWP